MAFKITKKDKDYSRWYTDVIAAAQLADYSPVKGCMVIRPNGYALWESIQKILDSMFKETGHENAYFPLFIPESFLKKEAEHVEGFAPECAVVTHGGGKKLEEPLVIRPTSETIIWAMFKKWIMSYRDLPVLINQWCNVVRWEMRTRLFLRTSEFLWQEGHTAHATREECQEETLKMLSVYKKFLEEYMAIPIITGTKTEKEKFAGAETTYTIEAMMQDKRALQAGTSHNLGQNFAKAFDVTFQDKDGERNFVWATSWGVSTRLIGALIMAHGDDKGIVIPPKLAPTQLVIIPIFTQEKELSVLVSIYKELKEKTKNLFTMKFDDRPEYSPGWKYHEWEQKGIPLRMEIGPRDVAKKQVVLVKRDTGEKIYCPMTDMIDTIKKVLGDIQESLFKRAMNFREENSFRSDSYDELKEIFSHEGGFVHAHWCGSVECENKVQEDTKATIRCMPLEFNKEEGSCIVCQKKSDRRVIFSKSY